MADGDVMLQSFDDVLDQTMLFRLRSNKLVFHFCDIMSSKLWSFLLSIRRPYVMSK